MYVAVRDKNFKIRVIIRLLRSFKNQLKLLLEYPINAFKDDRI